jgi:predicted anti-sigma-YlaC factor YlaD
MFCDEALDAIEPIAAGELKPEGRVAEHLTSCPNCAAALARARELERMLEARPLPKPPSQFTSRTMTRVRRARWRSDQYLDLGFNLALGLLAFAIVAVVLILMRRTGLGAIGTDIAGIFGSGFVALAQRVSPSVPLYAGASALLVSALAIWWWAERDATL